MVLILLVTCEAGLRIRLAYLYRSPAWLLYHQFKLRTEDEINREVLPSYYKDNMFRPYKLVYREERPVTRKEIITVESSALRSIRRQLEKMLKDSPDFVWLDYSPNAQKEIEFSNNNVVLYEFLVYPDVYNSLKREARMLKKLVGPTIDDFLYHNFVFYMHIDENINFTTMNSDKMIEEYLALLISREEPFCRSIAEHKYKNVIYIIAPNRFDGDSSGGRVYLKYINAAYKTIIPLLEKYHVNYLDFMNEKMDKGDFKDYFHFSPAGGRKISYKILDYLTEERFLDAL